MLWFPVFQCYSVCSELKLQYNYDETKTRSSKKKGEEGDAPSTKEGVVGSYRSGHVSWGLVIWLGCIKEEKPNSDDHSEDEYGDYTCKQQAHLE